MDNHNMDQPIEKKMSRRKLISSLGTAGVAVVAGGLLTSTAYGATVTGSVYGGGSTSSTTAGEPTAAKKYTGILDKAGKIVIPHGLGDTLPANVLLVDAFIKLPSGVAKKVDVEVDSTNITVACGVPNIPVRVGLLYSTTNSSW